MLKTLQGPILHKLESASVANIADVLFAYSTASNGGDMLCTAQEHLPDGEVSFVNKVQKSLEDKVIMLDYFNTINTTKAQWALSRYQTRDIVPSYHLDAANAIVSRQDLSKVSSVSHAIYKHIVDVSLSKRKVFTPQNQSIQLFAQASVGYHN